MSVWDDLVGQQDAVQVLRRAVAGADGDASQRHAMTHAWLFTGPPGSGRSNAARAFAAALQCSKGGCGVCNACRTALSGAHPDVTLVRTEQLSIGVDEVRDLARRASMSPTLGRFQVIVVEDADRVTERGADALLKSVEEPSPKTVWILCAPTADDVVATIRSRCRLLHLRTPTNDDVAHLLAQRDGIDPAMAAYAARAAQGHIGRARVLARDEAARNRRHDILKVPGQLVSVGACLTAASNIVKAAADEAASATGAMDASEKAELSEALGFGAKGARPRNAQAALKDLEDQQKARAKRIQRDALDRALTELTTYYRDVLVEQTTTGDASSRFVNPEMREAIRLTARATTPERTLRSLDAILEARTALEGNVAPLLAIEAMLLAMAPAAS